MAAALLAEFFNVELVNKDFIRINKSFMGRTTTKRGEHKKKDHEKFLCFRLDYENNKATIHASLFD
ncbi:CLUMA_CG003868, isoform A [Clunio marinus]|uniref:CLUMA_CG003868, isoform A n=1 Tax=Clunio marinus TaxID=568069 RepID=A0A1J1HQ19_9DIPT|nr:CLUMA_CG003868, isoform A [Clunio marinus]